MTVARSSINFARDDLRTAVLKRARALTELEKTRADLEQNRRQFAPDSQQVLGAKVAFDKALTDWQVSVADEKKERKDLSDKIAKWLSDDDSGFLSEDQELSKIQVDQGIVLFPVRLETRFDIGAKILRVRIYPDEIFANAHDPFLTAEETAARDAFKQVQEASESPEDLVQPWADLVKRFTSQRAAYIINDEAGADIGGDSAHITAPGSPGRPVQATMPDRWVVATYRDGERKHLKHGLPIPEPLDLTPDFLADEADATLMAPIGDGFSVPANIAWTLDFQRALDVGMAIELTLSDEDVAAGFDRLVVYGVKTSMEDGFEEDHAGWHLERLFAGHRYRRGMALVPKGTPTNNIPGKPTSFPPPDPNGENSFPIEVNPSIPPTDQGPYDIDNLRETLGIETLGPMLGAVGDGALRQQTLGGHMNAVLWPGTLGYFMKHLMCAGWAGGATGFSDTAIDYGKKFFTDYVTSAGPFPILRVGAVPYGVLPVVSLEHYVADPRRGTPSEDNALGKSLRHLVEVWKSASNVVTKLLRNTSNVPMDVLKIVAQPAASNDILVRRFTGPLVELNLRQFTFQSTFAFLGSRLSTALACATAVGHAEWKTARILFSNLSDKPLPFDGPFVTETPDPKALEPTMNYIAWLARADLTAADLKSGFSFGTGKEPLLYLLLLHALLCECVRIGVKLWPTEFQSVLGSIDTEKELWTTQEGANTLFTVFDHLAPDDTERTIFAAIRESEDYQEHRKHLETLSTVPTQELQRLFVDTLDACSHRLDAWATGLAWKRLWEVTRNKDLIGWPLFIGGYGWVEDVRPKTNTKQVTIPGLGNVDLQSENGGFVHAPSMAQANAAAILRCGRMSEKASESNAYAIDLSSRRTRKARRLIDGLRAGQSLGAQLGFELEEGLRATGMANREKYILALRNFYPLVANKTETANQDPADQKAARNVVDGLALLKASKGEIYDPIPYGSGGLPGKNDPDGITLAAEIKKLDEGMDCLGDLTTAESILQISTGDLQTAKAVLDAMAEGNPPPEPELCHSPAVGVGIQHQVALLLGEKPATSATGWPAKFSPRTRACMHGSDPAPSVPPAPPTFPDVPLDEWAGRLLGDPTKATVQVSYKVKVSGNETDKSIAVSVGELGLRPLDFLALARGYPGEGNSLILDRRLVKKGLGQDVPVGAVTVTYKSNTDGNAGVVEMLIVAKALGEFLGGVRDLRATDLLRDEDQADMSAAVNALSSRAQAAQDAAEDAADDLRALSLSSTGEAWRLALESAANFVADAFPDPQFADGDLPMMGRSIIKDLDQRVRESSDLAAAGSVGSDSAAKLAKHGERLRKIFGGHSVAATVDLVLGNAGELKVSLDELLSQATPLPGDDENQKTKKKARAVAPGRLLRQAMRTHEGLIRWRKFGLLAAAMGKIEPRLAVAQVPYVKAETGESEEWVGYSAPKESRLSLLLLSVDGTAPDTSKPWRGLLLDSWTELVPKPTVETGVALNYDHPCAEAPQVILVATAPDQNVLSNAWSVEWLLATIQQAADLARIRPLTLGQNGLGQLLPGICVANNYTPKTASTIFQRRGELMIR